MAIPDEAPPPRPSRRARPWSLLGNAALIVWTLFGPWGLLWIVEHRQQLDSCAALGVIPMHGPSAVLSFAALLLVARARSQSRDAFAWGLGSWLLLLLLQAFYWAAFVSLPPATKC